MNLELIIGIGGVITAITVIGIFFSKSFKGFKRIIHFIDDFMGEDARPGVPARPGFSERMGHMEISLERMCQKMDSMQKRIESIEEELNVNGGKTVKDAIIRIEKRLNNWEGNNA
jgi:hypothetical protein